MAKIWTESRVSLQHPPSAATRSTALAHANTTTTLPTRPTAAQQEHRRPERVHPYAASVAAGVAIKKLIEEKKITGTIKVYGCPAEEGGSGKVYMVRAGLFNNVDVAIHWHPGDGNGVTMSSALANSSAKFRFLLCGSLV